MNYCIDGGTVSRYKIIQEVSWISYSKGGTRDL